MSEYRVNLEIFNGPLDLLLYLVRKEEVDIYDIPIARVTEQYIRYLEMLRQFDIEIAGEFLIMAATLMEIKSAMLLPPAEAEEDIDEDVCDPRHELVRQLLEYKRFKDMANRLDSSAEERSQRHSRPGTILSNLKPDAEPEYDMEEVSIWTLLEAFDTIMQSVGTYQSYEHITDDTPIDLYQIEVLHQLQSEGPLTLERIVRSRPNKMAMVGVFLAMLELIRDQLVAAEQPESMGAIYLRPLTDEPAEQAVQNAIYAHAEEAAPAEAAEPQSNVQQEDAESDFDEVGEDDSELPDEENVEDAAAPEAAVEEAGDAQGQSLSDESEAAANNAGATRPPIRIQELPAKPAVPHPQPNAGNADSQS